MPLLLLAFAASGAQEKRKPAMAVLYFDYTGDDPKLVVLRKGLA